MVSFENDYNVGAHENLLKALIDTNMEPLSGYGLDKYSDSAKEKIKKAIGLDSISVEFLVGGTQTNAVVISTMLKDYEGVIAADTGHISVHEAGAIEYTGYKVITLKSTDGKIDASVLKKYLVDFFADENYSHMVIPGLVYISFPTEYGTIYTKKELESIYNICNEYGLVLYIDGARLGYGLMSRECDMTFTDIAKFSHVFYIGGTKVGALMGEAVVFTKNNEPKNFITSIKKRGALLAKGRLLGIQFDTLFTDNLYFDISKNAIEKAKKLKEILKSAGLKFYIDSPTNQQFVIMPNEKIQTLQKKVAFRFWEKYDDTHTVVRFVTSFATTDLDLTILEEALKS